MNINEHKCGISVGVFASVSENARVCDCAAILFSIQCFFLFTEVPYPDMWELGHIAHYQPALIKVPILETDSCCHVPRFQWLSVPVAALQLLVGWLRLQGERGLTASSNSKSC